MTETEKSVERWHIPGKGDWVPYADHLAAIAKAKKEMAERCAQKAENHKLPHPGIIVSTAINLNGILACVAADCRALGEE